MQQISVLRDRWKALITVRLTPKLKACICDLQQDPMSEYDKIKACLLANTGMSRANASQKLFTLAWESLRGKSTGEVLQYLERIISTIYEGSTTEQDRQARLMLARICTIVDEDFRLHLDHCAIQTRQDLKLKLTLESLESSQSGLHREERYRLKQ